MNKKAYTYFKDDDEPVKLWCKRIGVPYSTVLTMLYKGYIVEDACRLAQEAHERKLNKKILSYNGKSIHSFLPDTLYTSIAKKMRKTGCDYEKALQTYKHNIKRNGYITINDIKKDLEYYKVKEND